MRSARIVLTLAVALLIACPALSAERKKRGEKKPPKCPVQQQIENVTKGLALTDAQKAKLEDIKKEIAPKITEATKAQDLLTPEQKKAAAEAAKANKAAGRKGKEALKAIDEAVKLTEDQKAKQAEAKKKLAALRKELNEKIQSVLTPEQKEQLKKERAAKRKHK